MTYSTLPQLHEAAVAEHSEPADLGLHEYHERMVEYGLPGDEENPFDECEPVKPVWMRRAA